ncbi:hypothetical protein F2P41_16820 [Acinetobacter baumannii]|uniref:Uncharacterized protein n=1 Tax=Acinetobacter baumannii TaxID=470 RepID=A0A5N5XW28_ACIBA|nr:hypothetical protein FDO31_17715 [Acinetobacter baumannii]MQR19906.1 hypothetical protein [Acinetobacter baumannii]MQR51183.1 hypothetical protein [Acinetobacter baumannii]
MKDINIKDAIFNIKQLMVHSVLLIILSLIGIFLLCLLVKFQYFSPTLNIILYLIIFLASATGFTVGMNNLLKILRLIARQETKAKN